MLKLYEKLSLQLDNIFESNRGYCAIQPGIYPSDWVKNVRKRIDMLRLIFFYKFCPI